MSAPQFGKLVAITPVVVMTLFAMWDLGEIRPARGEVVIDGKYVVAFFLFTLVCSLCGYIGAKMEDDK